MADFVYYVDKRLEKHKERVYSHSDTTTVGANSQEQILVPDYIGGSAYFVEFYNSGDVTLTVTFDDGSSIPLESGVYYSKEGKFYSITASNSSPTTSGTLWWNLYASYVPRS